MSSTHRLGITQSALRWVLWLGIIIGVTLVIFWNDLLIVINEGLVAEGYSHVLLLPFIVGYLVYRRRQILSAIQNLPDRRHWGDTWTVVGGSLLLTVFVVYFYASETTYSLEWRLLMLPVFVTGMVLVIFGYRFWRLIAIPIAFLVFFEPYFIEITNPYWAILANISAIGAHDFLAMLGYATTLTTSLTGPVIQTNSIQGIQYAFDIGVGSSGLQSLTGYTLFAVLVAYLFSGSMLRRFVLFVVGYPLLVALNIIRIVGVIGLTNFVGQTAGSIFHLTGGLVLVFLGTILLLLIGQRFLRLGFGPNTSSIKPCQHQIRGDRFCFQCGRVLPGRGPSITRSRVTGLAVIAVAGLLLFSIQTPAYAQTATVTKVDLSSQSPAVLMQLLPTVPGWNLSLLYRDNATQAALQEDAALVFIYQRNSTVTGQQQMVYAIVEIGTVYHTWEDSLVTHAEKYGLPSANVLADQAVHIVGSVTLPATFFVFQRPGSNLTEAVLEWITRSSFLIGGTYQGRFVMMSIYQNVPALANAGLISNSSDLQQVLNVYMPFALQVVNYWAPANTVTYVHLNFPIAYALVGSILVPETLAVAGYSVGTSGRRRAVRRIVQGVASKDDILMLKAVESANKSGNGLLEEIRDAYTKLGGPPSSVEGFAGAISRASELGIVEPSIVEQSGAPYLAWRLNDGAETLLGPATLAADEPHKGSDAV